MSTNYYDTCALQTNGRLKFWGSYDDGQVSGPNTSTETYTAVSAGYFHTCARRTDGRLKCWGDGGSLSRDMVYGPNGSTDSYIAVSAAPVHTCAVRTDGRLKCWGFDRTGQVSGPNASTDAYTSVNTSGTHTCALRVDRRLVCWGDDAYGEISGPNTSTDNYSTVSTAGGQTCAVTTTGHVTCWGWDEYGQVAGTNASTEIFTAVSAGSDHTCALRADRRIVCWGKDDYVQVSGPNEVTQADALNRLDCNDGNPCTDDSSDPASGCVHVPNVAPCNDGNACTLLDTCSGGTCVGANPAACTAVDQCHAPGVCDLATGACSNPTKLDGTLCTDNNLCTTGDACQAGVCTPTHNGLDEPNPRTNGYYKRLCHGPHSGDQLTDADAACIAQITATFAGISTLAQICEEIEPSHPNNDKCDQTEDDLMVLALNLCRARVCTEQSIDSQCGGNGNVAQLRYMQAFKVPGRGDQHRRCARAEHADVAPRSRRGAPDLGTAVPERRNRGAERLPRLAAVARIARAVHEDRRGHELDLPRHDVGERRLGIRDHGGDELRPRWPRAR